MTINEIIEILSIPSTIKDLTFIAVILSLVEISPLKINPWKWIKSFVAIPKRINDIEDMIERDKAQRWRTEILHFADAVRRTNTSDPVCKSQLFSKETWDDVIDNIDSYNRYCNAHPEFRNGKTTAATLFLNNYYAEGLENPAKFLD